jgi:hypothetical protein
LVSGAAAAALGGSSGGGTGGVCASESAAFSVPAGSRSARGSRSGGSLPRGGKFGKEAGCGSAIEHASRAGFGPPVAYI